jgi:hypothetical protein
MGLLIEHKCDMDMTQISGSGNRYMLYRVESFVTMSTLHECKVFQKEVQINKTSLDIFNTRLVRIRQLLVRVNVPFE